MTVTIRYFARLADEAGTTSETVTTAAATVGALWAEAAARHGLNLAADRVKLAAQGAYCGPDTPLTEGLEVVFMPPVAGG